MRMAHNDHDDRVGLRGYVQFNKYTHIYSETGIMGSRVGTGT